MTRYPFRSACLPVGVSVFGFVLQLLQVALRPAAILLGFSGIALAANEVPKEGDVYAKIGYSAGCSTPALYSSIDELIGACKQRIPIDICVAARGCLLLNAFVNDNCNRHPILFPL